MILFSEWVSYFLSLGYFQYQISFLQSFFFFFCWVFAWITFYVFFILRIFIFQGVRAKKVFTYLYLYTLRSFSLSPLDLFYLYWYEEPSFDSSYDCFVIIENYCFNSGVRLFFLKWYSKDIEDFLLIYLVTIIDKNLYNILFKMLTNENNQMSNISILSFLIQYLLNILCCIYQYLLFHPLFRYGYKLYMCSMVKCWHSKIVHFFYMFLMSRSWSYFSI